MDIPVTSIFVVAAVAGFVEFVRRAFKRDVEGAVIIAGSAGIGAAAGHFAVDGLTFTTGMVAALAASGLITFAQKWGQGTTYPDGQ